MNNSLICTENKIIKISIPAELAEKYGLEDAEQLSIEEYSDGIFIKQSSDILKRIYVEVTNRCNLNCKTCVRNVWSEESGMMEYNLFKKLLSDAAEYSDKLTFFFGGWGEPLMHHEIFRMISAVKSKGFRAELITNGTMLTESTIERLIDSGLDLLWTSLDGATPESYQDVRMGNLLPEILHNLQNLKHKKIHMHSKTPHQGIAFVAMENNISDLPDILKICRSLNVKKLSVSNVLPFTEELKEKRLYKKAAGDWENNDITIDFPRVDASDEISSVIKDLAGAGGWPAIAGSERDRRVGSCPFLRKGSLSVRWDGKVSPCTPLFYDNTSFLEDTLRESKAKFFGDIKTERLEDLWMNEKYRVFRKTLQSDEFAPCTVCNSCEMAESNIEDCYGETHPVCGGCLWQQGFIQCP